jgi:cytochrome P450
MTNQPAESDLDRLETPRSAYYDHLLSGWVLSRYADVFTALHDERLCPVSSHTEDVPRQEEMNSQHQLRRHTLAACSGRQIKAWQILFDRVARQRITKLCVEKRADIIGDFAEPWALEAAITVTGADRKSTAHLNALAHVISMASADPSDQSRRQSANAADDELAVHLQSSPIPMSGPAFVAISQTLPSFLGNAWLALLRNPRQLELLRAEPGLMPVAVEELLRYAGLAHTLFRRASATSDMAGVTIARGDRVMLKLSSANRDSAQFESPERLDISRRNGPQLALGTGMHSCAGGLLIRTLAGIATTCFVENVAGYDPTIPIEWKGGTGFRSPKTLHVLLKDTTQSSPPEALAK